LVPAFLAAAFAFSTFAGLKDAQVIALKSLEHSTVEGVVSNATCLTSPVKVLKKSSKESLSSRVTGLARSAAV